MSQVLSRISIAGQDRGDAQDAAKGHQVYCPYREGTEAAKLWQAAFTRYSLALDECEACA